MTVRFLGPKFVKGMRAWEVLNSSGTRCGYIYSFPVSTSFFVTNNAGDFYKANDGLPKKLPSIDQAELLVKSRFG